MSKTNLRHVRERQTSGGGKTCTKVISHDTDCAHGHERTASFGGIRSDSSER